MSYNIGIIGAARRRQGTGPYIARSFHQLGHRVCAIIGSSQSSITQTQSQLYDQYAIKVDAYTEFDDMIDAHDLDIIVIASPPNTHLDYLIKALQHGCHVFCEKPIWWPSHEAGLIDYDEYLQKITHVIELASNNKLYLHLNTQWPYTLQDFIHLHPQAFSSGAVTQFAMHLSPQSTGSSMLVDAASHGLSMLYQLVGTGEISNIRVSHKDNGASIDFSFEHQAGCTACTLGFLQSNETPKPASYQINGFTVKRIVKLPEYQIQLQSEQEVIAIHDPLDASIKDFLAGIEAQLTTDAVALRHGAVHLHQLIEHFI